MYGKCVELIARNIFSIFYCLLLLIQLSHSSRVVSRRHAHPIDNNDGLQSAASYVENALDRSTDDTSMIAQHERHNFRHHRHAGRSSTNPTHHQYQHHSHHRRHGVLNLDEPTRNSIVETKIRQSHKAGRSNYHMEMYNMNSRDYRNDPLLTSTTVRSMDETDDRYQFRSRHTTNDLYANPMRSTMFSDPETAYRQNIENVIRRHETHNANLLPLTTLAPPAIPPNNDVDNTRPLDDDDVSTLLFHLFQSAIIRLGDQKWAIRSCIPPPPLSPLLGHKSCIRRS